VSQTTELLATIKAAGLTVTARGGSLLVSPAARLTAELSAQIRAHKPALLAMLTVPLADVVPECQGECPGPLQDGCRGCPSPAVELLWPSGCIAARHCLGQPDAGAGWWRYKGEATWRAVPGRTLPRPSSNIAAGFAPLTFAD
jgi:hypothetical protein